MNSKRFVLMTLVSSLAIGSTACNTLKSNDSPPRTPGGIASSPHTTVSDRIAPAEPHGAPIHNQEPDFEAPEPKAKAHGAPALSESASDAARKRRPSPPPGPSGDAFDILPKPQHQPGLATTWGEKRFSSVRSAPFVRADRSRPFAAAKLFYNDADGVASMSDTRPGARRSRHAFPIGNGWLSVGLRDGSGQFLTGFAQRGDNFVTARSGDRYSIVVRNHSPGRVEVVVSVDGLDVIDGRPASFSKRGYLVDANDSVEIDGFRTSTRQVAAFRFGSVRNSYAGRKHGDTRNVGVIGVAAFNQAGDSPRFWGSSRSHEDVVLRRSADPFPDRFSAPPR